MTKIIDVRKKWHFSIGMRSNFFPRGRIEKQIAWDAPNLGVLCGLAEVRKAVLNSVVEFLLHKVRWFLL